MVIKAPTTDGLDWYIDRVQSELHDFLGKRWNYFQPDGLLIDAGRTLDAFRLYARVSRTQKEGGYIAEWYDGGEYTEVYWDDSLLGVAFFGEGQKTETTTQNRVDLHLVAFIDTNAILGSGDKFRFDTKIRNDFQAYFKGAPYGFELQSIETGIQNVLREYPSSRRDSRLVAADMETVHAFRLNFSVYYDPDRLGGDLGSIV